MLSHHKIYNFQSLLAALLVFACGDDLEIKEALDKYENCSLKEIQTQKAPENSPGLFQRHRIKFNFNAVSIQDDFLSQQKGKVLQKLYVSSGSIVYQYQLNKKLK